MQFSVAGRSLGANVSPREDQGGISSSEREEFPHILPGEYTFFIGPKSVLLKAVTETRPKMYNTKNYRFTTDRYKEPTLETPGKNDLTKHFIREKLTVSC